MLERRNGDAATGQTEKTARLKGVEHTRHVKTAIAHLSGKLTHQDMKDLGAGRIDTTVDEKVHYTLLERLRSPTPRTMRQTLMTGGEDAKQIEADNEKVVEQTHHLVFRKRDEVAFGSGLEGMGEALRESEEHFGLKHVGSRQVLVDRIRVVVAGCGNLQLAAHKEEKLLAGIARADDNLTGRGLHEAELGVTRHLLKIGAAQSLKQRELQKLVIEPQFVVHDIVCYVRLFLDFVFERGRIPDSKLALLVGIDEIGHQLGVARQQLACLVEPHDHERGGIGIGSGTVGG